MQAMAAVMVLLPLRALTSPIESNVAVLLATVNDDSARDWTLPDGSTFSSLSSALLEMEIEE